MTGVDLAPGCIEDIPGITLGELEGSFCVTCQNPQCSRAKCNKFVARIATQPERFFKPEAADPNSSRYQGLITFMPIEPRATVQPSWGEPAPAPAPAPAPQGFMVGPSAEQEASAPVKIVVKPGAYIQFGPGGPNVVKK